LFRATKPRTRTPSAGSTPTLRPTIACARSLLRSPARATHPFYPPRFSPPRQGTSCRVRLPRGCFDPSGEDASLQHLQPITRPEHSSNRPTLESPRARFRGTTRLPRSVTLAETNAPDMNRVELRLTTEVQLPHPRHVATRQRETKRRPNLPSPRPGALRAALTVRGFVGHASALRACFWRPLSRPPRGGPKPVPARGAEGRSPPPPRQRRQARTPRAPSAGSAVHTRSRACARLLAGFCNRCDPRARPRIA